MTTASIVSRTLTLTRLERAAGQTFGWEDDGSSAPRVGLLNPKTLAFAAFAAAAAATIAYLV